MWAEGCASPCQTGKRSEVQPSLTPSSLGQLPWMALAFVDRSCLRDVGMFELKLHACGHLLRGPLCRSVGQGSAGCTSCSWPSGGSSDRGLLWSVYRWAHIEHAWVGFEVFSCLCPQRPPAPPMTSRAVPGGDPVGLTWGDSRGSDLPSLGAGTPQHKKLSLPWEVFPMWLH